MSIRPAILVVGTLDTKGDEIAFTAAAIEQLGARAVVMDSGTGHSGKPAPADIDGETVARAAGTSIAELALSPSRGEAIARMAEGVRVVVADLHARGEIDGAICIGGAGATLATAAFDALPVGFPKLIVSPLASGPRTFDMFVGTRDVAVMHSVCDIMGINPISEPVFVQAAGAIVGMARAVGSANRDWGRRYIAASMNGNTTEAVSRIRGLLAAQDVGVVVFHANGAGGRAMERAVGDGYFDAVLDFTTTELSGHEFGGMMGSGPDRMEVAGRAGIPQVLVPGCIDMLTDGRYDDVAERYPGRRLYRHNPALTLVRLEREQMEEMGRVFARKALAAQGPVRVVVPTAGLSIPDSPGGPFWDPEADAAFVDALRLNLNGAVEIECVDAHINSERFGERVIAHINALLSDVKQHSGRVNAHR